jgi:hypothetical protein
MDGLRAGLPGSSRMVLEGSTVIADIDKTPRWQKLAALALFLVNMALIVVAWQRLRTDFWPLDRSFVGPNLVASIVQFDLAVIAGILIWPPTRHRLRVFLARERKHTLEHEKWVAGRLDRIHLHVTGEHAEAHPHADEHTTLDA